MFVIIKNSQNNTVNLRTVALVGHGAAGKITLAETLLASAGAITNRRIDRKGKYRLRLRSVKKKNRAIR